METKYLEHLTIASSIENNTEKLMYLTSLLRSLLQTTVIITFELTKKETSYDEVGLIEFINRFLKPVDGLPFEIFTHLIPLLRDNMNNAFLLGWFEETKQIKKPLNKELQKWVTFRNSKPAHGVLDNPTAEEWSIKTEDIIRDCLVVFSSILPINESPKIRFLKEFKSLEISVPLIYNDNIFVIQNISSKKGIWKLKGQVLSLEEAKEFRVDLVENNIFSTEGLESIEKYPHHTFLSNNTEHILQHNIPVRQTDIFVGRDKELEEMREWIDDEDSRACLIYGDGGYGKTTLVLEFFNKMLESKFDFEKSPPLIVTYYTAKKTRWNEAGLIYLPTTHLAMDECIRELMRCIYPNLPKEWYAVTGSKIIDKAKGELVKNQYERNDILFIIDNTETLASTPEDTRELNDFFNLIRKKLGRIIITSRRRESFEAKPLQIKGLTDAESIELLKKLAKVYNAKSINQAGDNKLKRVSKELMNKPLLIESLVKYIANSDLGIEKAISKIFKTSNEDLLKFLYEDAWFRMINLQKEVFYVMIHMQTPLDANSIGEICQEIKIQYTEFLQALEETYFASEEDHNNSYKLELVELAKEFFSLKFKTDLNKNEKDKFRRVAEKVDKVAIKRREVEQVYKKDRVAEAYRSDYAKSARISADKGDIEIAVEMYELAIEDDPLNSALHYKFSWFLLNRTQNFEYAKELSQKALKLNSNSQDATVGLSLVYYRLGDIANGDKYIDKANKLGRTLSFSLLRKGIARYHKAKKQSVSISSELLEDGESLLHNIGLLDSPIELLVNSLTFLQSSEAKNDRVCGYDRKNAEDTNHYLRITQNLLKNLRTKQTKSISKLRGMGIEYSVRKI